MSSGAMATYRAQSSPLTDGNEMAMTLQADIDRFGLGVVVNSLFTDLATDP